MNVLLDACVWGGAAEVVRAAGHAVEAVAGWPRDPGDEDILHHAFQQAQVLVTLDKDFGELAVVREMAHRGIVRLVNLRGSQQGLAIVQTLATYADDLERGAIVTVEPERVRVRPADQEP